MAWVIRSEILKNYDWYAKVFIGKKIGSMQKMDNVSRGMEILEKKLKNKCVSGRASSYHLQEAV